MSPSRILVKTSTRCHGRLPRLSWILTGFESNGRKDVAYIHLTRVVLNHRCQLNAKVKVINNNYCSSKPIANTNSVLQFVGLFSSTPTTTQGSAVRVYANRASLYIPAQPYRSLHNKRKHYRIRVAVARKMSCLRVIEVQVHQIQVYFVYTA